MRFVFRVFGLASCLLMSSAALAWGPLGHQIVGATADKLIAGSKAAKEVRRILGTNLQTASVWADCAKGVVQHGTTFSYDKPGNYAECAIFETPAGEAQMVDFVKRNAGVSCASNASDEKCRHKQYHFTDVSNLRDHYDKHFTGTSDHDLISAISAAIAVLQDKPSPAPFNITTKREALRLLAHYVGDIHQPMHVASVYLNSKGKVIDPDAGNFDPKTTTKGGNAILDGSTKLHAEWDSVSAALGADVSSDQSLVEAKAVPVSAGPPSDWSTTWATDTLVTGKAAFKGLKFSTQDLAHVWHATHPPTYSKDRRTLQRQQLIKGGARLAQMLQAIWP